MFNCGFFNYLRSLTFIILNFFFLSQTHGYDNINLTLVCPSYINTGMFNGVKPRLMPMLEPKYVADQITLAVQKNQVYCILPDGFRILLQLKR